MNFIDNIEIKNFKSIHNQKIEGCKRINVFIGYPNVGKSNILEALSLLTFIRQKKPVGLKGLVRFEKFTQIFYNSNIQNPAIIEFNKKYSINIKYEDERGVLFRLIDHKGTDFLYNSGRLSLKVGKEELFTSSTDEVDDFSGRINELQSFNVKPYKFSETKIYNNDISALELNIPFGKNLFEVIINNEKLRNEFSDLLKPYNLDLIIDSSSNDIKISPRIKNGIINTLPISLIADTLIRLVFFKAAIHSNKNAILLFEEPEAHMFPPYVKKFTSDVIFDESNQFFVTTHSPYVLEEFIEEIEKDLAVYIVDYDKGETLIKRLSDEQVLEVAQYGIDLFFNLESYLDKYGQPHSA
jgi:AAA15 family ATPase/GTPase